MHFGFYEELDDLRVDDSDADFGFLENISNNEYIEFVLAFGETKKYLLSAYDFLHGYCDIFAKRIHDQFSLPMYAIYSESGDMVHCFCKINADGRDYYIDVRGITDDYTEFISEFEDWIDIDISLKNTFPFISNQSLSYPDRQKQIEDFADTIITNYLKSDIKKFNLSLENNIEYDL